MKTTIGLITIFLFVCTNTLAGTFPLPAANEGIIGEIDSDITSYQDTLSDVARRHDIGYEEIKLANPAVDPWKPGENSSIVLPDRYLLPNAERKGIVINIPEMRLYYYPKSKDPSLAEVSTHPISIGRQGWSTPKGLTKIVSKTANPAWYPPESIRREHEENGDPLPKVVPAGPDNPLGLHAMKLGIPGYLLHGTNKPYGVGMRVSHGCIRLYPEDIEVLFANVRVGTQVRLINQPYKIGWKNNELYLEIHPPLIEEEPKYQNAFSLVVEQVLQQDKDIEIDWDQLEKAVVQRSGIPVKIGQLMVTNVSDG